ncbi:hypothetical protein Tco_0690371 [Tanacetum coccineum]
MMSALKLHVIVNGDSISLIASASAGFEGHIPPKTAEQKLARKNELKQKSTIMLAIPDEHLLKFHACREAKSLWEAIQNRFQKLISQLEIHGEVISQEDANLKLLRSLPSAWNNIDLIMRNKSNIDTLSMDDLYNNLKDYEFEIKGKSISSSNSQNVAFVSFDNSSSTNETVNTTHSLDYEDLEQIVADDLKEIDLKWQVVILTMKVKRFIKKMGRKMVLNDKETVGFDRTKVECYNYHRRGYFARECRALRNQGNRNRDAQDRNAPSGSNYSTNGCGSSSSDSEVHICSKDCLESYKTLQKQYDQQREALNKSNLEIIESSKNLTKLINSQISAKDKTGLGYDSQINESEVVYSMFNSRESDMDNSLVIDRFKTGEGFHAVPPPYTRNYMSSRPDLSFAGLDDYVYKTKVHKTETSISKTSKDIVEKPKTVRSSAPIIEE